MNKPKKCNKKMNVFARVCGFYRPINQWNRGKRDEYKDRKNYIVE